MSNIKTKCDSCGMEHNIMTCYVVCPECLLKLLKQQAELNKKLSKKFLEEE